MTTKVVLPKLYYVDYDYNVKYKTKETLWEMQVETTLDNTRKWGQKKNYIVEVYYITLFHVMIPKFKPNAPKVKLVIYVGSSPGFHLIALAKLFPDLRFILCDPRPPGFAWREHPQFRYVPGYFSSQVGKKILQDEGISNENTLFMVDIRDVRGTPTSDKGTDEQKIDIVSKDMMMQQEWTTTLRPLASMLKLRFPYMEGNSEEFQNKNRYVKYLDGLILLQPYVGKKSTEERLIIPNPDIFRLMPNKGDLTVSSKLILVSDVYHTTPYAMKEYDALAYERSLYFFNVVVRPPYVDRFKGDPDMPFDVSDLSIVPTFPIPIKELDAFFRAKNLEYTEKTDKIIADNQTKIKKLKEIPVGDISNLELDELELANKQLKQDKEYRDTKMAHHDNFASCWDLYAELLIWEFYLEAGLKYPDIPDEDQTPVKLVYYSTVELILSANETRGRPRGWAEDNSSDESN